METAVFGELGVEGRGYEVCRPACNYFFTSCREYFRALAGFRYDRSADKDERKRFCAEKGEFRVFNKAVCLTAISVPGNNNVHESEVR